MVYLQFLFLVLTSLLYHGSVQAQYTHSKLIINGANAAPKLIPNQVFVDQHLSDSIKTIKDANDFKTQLANAGEKLVVIAFFATWCSPCKKIEPKLKELAQQYTDKLIILKVDVNKCEDIAMENNVSSVSTFLFLKNSKKVDQFSGSNAAKLADTIAKHI
ncbi:thioredoxin-2-like [Drosophila sulfurigaster albostrigata]|uniref:thioredoxin-2-like n=1 Tax=Drosophila sulfurigaster albostrigata TaxID=89887 RepID=UPI002D21AB3D|nr:thioredoxin-2-like [Drosophila sulfurigaster albostrigata]